MASVVAPGSRHMAGRSSRTFDLGIHRTIHLSATQPHDELIAALNHFQPDFLTGYASVIALLAADQADGRLTITPSIVSTSSEPRSAPMTDRIRDAWGIEPFDVYATTETGVLALDCAAHSGQHVFEDIAIVEVVDEDDGPVPDGQPGHHLLVTNLYNRTQPFIRYRLSDMTGFQPGSCSCGLPFRRLQTIAGRQDDILELPGANGSAVQLHPTALAPLFALDGVAELEIVQRGHQLHTTIVPRPTAQPDAVTALLNERIQATLAGCGCAAVPVHIHLASQLTRHPIAGKIKLVRREDGP
jgi:phenylacetate-coenzyme A ligase PaaK-like adenylate-forming protein